MALPAEGPVKLVQADRVVQVVRAVQVDRAAARVPVDVCRAVRHAEVLTVRPTDNVRRGHLVHKQISCRPKCVLVIAP